MKIKTLIGQSINEFTILDSFAADSKSGNKTYKVLLRCERCGREFERCHPRDFSHVKCKCMCEYLKPKPEKYHWIEYDGERMILKDFCHKYGLQRETTSGRIRRGWTPQECIDGKHLYKIECKQCKMIFDSESKSAIFCSHRCRRRHKRNFEKLPQPQFYSCEVCHSIFISTRKDAQCCSQECRIQLSRIERSGRYKHLKRIGKYDPSVTLVNVFERFNGICCGCGKKLSFDGDFRSNNYPSMDHIIPLSKGGVHEWDNMQLLCRSCNCMKGAS